MKKVLFLSVLIFSLISCGSKQKKVQTIEIKTPTEEAKAVEDKSIQKDMETFIDLYNELIAFKGKDDFKRFGFAQGGLYYTWLERANSMVENANLSHFTKYGFVPGDLVALGNLYVSSKGKETDATRVLRNAIDSGIAKATGKEIVTKESKPISLKGDETIIGHWKVTGPMNYDIKIVKQGNQYVSLENNKTVKLTKKGDKYYLENSKTGEYYKIVNGKIRFYDKDGDFTDLFKFKVETIL